MNKHDRLMNALAEIKETCIKNDDPEFGCGKNGKKCPFLIIKDGEDIWDCEITRYVHADFYSPDIWGKDNG